MILSDNPQDAIVATQFKERRAEFDKTAREWTKNYANPEKLKRDKIAKITDMGFTEEQAVQALDKTGWDEQEAIQRLLA